MTRTIIVPRRNRPDLVVIVDEADWPTVSKHRWSPAGEYVARPVILDGGRRAAWPMHREILGLEIGDPRVVHHLNENPVDNRRANLQVCESRMQAQAAPHPKRDDVCREGGRNGAAARWGKR